MNLSALEQLGRLPDLFYRVVGAAQHHVVHMAVAGRVVELFIGLAALGLAIAQHAAGGQAPKCLLQGAGFGRGADQVVHLHPAR